MAISERIKRPVERVKSWYGKYERPISSLSLIGGFVFDAIFLKRVDLFWENFWVIVHIVLVGTCIVLIHALERQEGDEANPSKLHFWLVNVQQFFYGGIWSVFLVFYFRSGDFTVSWPFLLILALSFIANERLKRSFVKLTFQISLFFLSIFCFAIFLVPVILHKIGPWVFLLSGVASLAFITLFLLLIRYVSKRPFGRRKWLLFGSIAGIFALVNILYFTGLIPPIPLSLKDAGVYYSVKRTGNSYTLLGEQKKWWQYFSLYPDFKALPGQPVYIFSAIFSPPGLDTYVFHEWQYKNPDTGKWQRVDIIPLQVIGGREGGFRTYSLKTTNLKPGEWRVNVLTTTGQVVGRVRFNYILASELPETKQSVD